MHRIHRLIGMFMLAVAACVDTVYAQNNLVSIELRAEKIEDAMQMLSDATGLNILVSSKATGTITAFVTEMEPEQALKQIIEINGFHYIRRENVVWVLTGEEYLLHENLGWERRIIMLQYAHVTRILPTIQQLIAPPSGDVLPSIETNALIIAAPPERLAAVEAVIQALDVPESTRVFELQHAAAPALLQMLQSYVTVPEHMFADPRTNQISVTGTEAQLESFSALLKKFDRPDQVVTKSIRLRYAKADIVAELLREIITGRKSTGTASVGGESLSGFGQQPPLQIAATAAPNASRATSSFALRGQSTIPIERAATAAPAPPTAAVSAPAALPDLAEGTEGDGTALGPLANVTADPRTNSVIITHTQAVVSRLEEVVAELDVPNEFHTYRFLNVNPAEIDLETKLIGLFTEEEPFLNVDGLTRTVTFRCGSERADEILALLRAWDRPVRQVNISADILRVNASVVQQLGISWQVILDDADDILGVLFPPGIAANSARSFLSAGNLADNKYNATIQALATDNDTKTIASPRITVRDGQEAVFSTARDEPYRVVTVDGNTQTTLEDVRFLNVGVNLSVTPTINDEDFVTLDVALEISDLVEIRDDIPVVDRSTAQSSVTVPSGGMAVLGGLRESSRADVSSGVPGLRKIPVLGSLFRNRRKDNSEFEIVLLLRPGIVGAESEVIPPLEELYDQASIRLGTDSQDYKLLTREQRKD